MSRPQPIEYADASAQVRAVFDDIKRSRNVEDVNNFWKYLAHDPVNLERTWTSIKEAMSPGALKPAGQGIALRRRQRHQWLRLLHREPHRLRAQGRHDRGDVRRVDGGGRMANETNRLANGYRVPIDAAFD